MAGKGLATLFGRLVFFGPLLYVGVTMVVDPAGFLCCCAGLARALRNFEHRLRGDPWLEPDSAHAPGTAVSAVRWCGLSLTVCAFLILAGLAD